MSSVALAVTPFNANADQAGMIVSHWNYFDMQARYNNEDESLHGNLPLVHDLPNWTIPVCTNLPVDWMMNWNFQTPLVQRPSPPQIDRFLFWSPETNQFLPIDGVEVTVHNYTQECRGHEDPYHHDGPGLDLLMNCPYVDSFNPINEDGYVGWFVSLKTMTGNWTATFLLLSQVPEEEVEDTPDFWEPDQDAFWETNDGFWNGIGSNKHKGG